MKITDSLTKDQINYIRFQQKRADAMVSDSESPYYEPDEKKRRTAAWQLMRLWEQEKARAFSD